MQPLIINHRNRIALYLVAGGICGLLGMLKISGVFDLGIQGLPREPILTYVSGVIGCCLLAYALYFVPRRFLFDDSIEILYILRRQELRWSEVTELRLEQHDTTKGNWRSQVVAILANIPPLETFLVIRLASGRKLSIRVEPGTGQQILALGQCRCNGATISPEATPARYVDFQPVACLPLSTPPDISSTGPSIEVGSTSSDADREDKVDSIPESDSQGVCDELWASLRACERQALIVKVKNCLTRAEVLDKGGWLNRDEDICAVVRKGRHGGDVKCWADDFAEALEILADCFLRSDQEEAND